MLDDAATDSPSAAPPPTGVGRGFIYDMWYFAAVSSELKAGALQRYEILGEPTSLRAGPARLRGSLVASPEIAEQAFREVEGQLTLETGHSFRVTMLGHSTGSNITYFEMRV